MSDFKTILAHVGAGNALDAGHAKTAFEIIMSGEASPAQIGAFLMALRVRGETVDEITGAASVMREMALHVPAPADAIDTCGTGGDASGTYNISTAVAFVAAGAGVKVAKHGNKALTSKSGSADVLRALGVRLELEPDAIARCIDTAGVGFMFAPQHHAAMKHVGPVRTELGTRTIFNVLGPLSNPAGTRRQLIGVYDRALCEPLAHVLQNLGATHAMVVHGEDGLDEMTTTGTTYVSELADGVVRNYEVTPEDAGLERAATADLVGGDASVNATALSALLDGKKGAYRDIVVLNAAAALKVAGHADTLQAGARQAEAAIDGGKARAALDALVTASNQS